MHTQLRQTYLDGILSYWGPPRWWSGCGLQPIGWRTLCTLPGSHRGNLLRWPCQLHI